MLPRVIGVVFELVSVATFCPPLPPTATAAHEMLAGEAAELPPVDPEPERVTTCGLLVAESTKLRLADRAPAAVGWKVIVAVQVVETATVLPHVVL